MKLLIRAKPIFDKDVKLYSYLIESLSENKLAGEKTESFLLRKAIVFSDNIDKKILSQISADKKAIIKCDSDYLLEKIPKMFSPEDICLEISFSSLTKKNLVQHVSELKNAGYTLILGDFEFNSDLSEIVSRIDNIMVCTKHFGPFLVRSLIRKFKNKSKKFILTNVENQDTFGEGVKCGYDYFEGNFFKKPRYVSIKNVSPLKWHCFQLLKEVQKPEINYKILEQIISQEPGISYKLLKLVNSAAMGVRNKIKSIQQALNFLGEKKIRRWISMILIQSMGTEEPIQLGKNSFQRAQFLQSLAVDFNLQKYQLDLYFLGLFSLLDALLQRPMEEVLEDIPVDVNVRNALLGKESRFTEIFNFIVAFEEGDSDSVLKIVKKLNLDHKKIEDYYMQSVSQANELFQRKRKVAS